VDAADLLVNGGGSHERCRQQQGPYVFQFTSPQQGVVNFTWRADTISETFRAIESVRRRRLVGGARSAAGSAALTNMPSTSFRRDINISGLWMRPAIG